MERDVWEAQVGILIGGAYYGELLNRLNYIAAQFEHWEHMALTEKDTRGIIESAMEAEKHQWMYEFGESALIEAGYYDEAK